MQETGYLVQSNLNKVVCILSKDLIGDIKRIEDQAVQIQKAAIEEANSIISQASIDAEQIYDSIIKKAEAEGQAGLEQVREETNDQIKDLKSKGQMECDQLASRANSRMDMAAVFIRERIVTNGNS